MRLKDNFSLRTVRKKIIMLSKLAGIVLIVSYIASTRISHQLQRILLSLSHQEGNINHFTVYIFLNLFD